MLLPLNHEKCRVILLEILSLEWVTFILRHPAHIIKIKPVVQLPQTTLWINEITDVFKIEVIYITEDDCTVKVDSSKFKID